MVLAAGWKNTFGLQVRNDWIHNGLFQSEDRVRVDKMDSSTGDTLPATTEADRFTDTQPGFYTENKIQWAEAVPLGHCYARRRGLLRRDQPGDAG